jgi:hypothetical protein
MIRVNIRDKTSLSLAIGGMGVKLIFNSEFNIESVLNHYSEFYINEDDQILLQIEVEIIESDSLSNNIEFRSNIDDIHFKMPPWQGTIDFNQGTGHLYIASSHTFEMLDYVLRIAYAYLAYRVGGFLFHAAGVIHDHQGYLFYGPSGSGKTTIARLSSGDVILNDDLVFVNRSSLGWQVYSTPFTNQTQVPPTRSVAHIDAIFRLIQDRKVFLEEMKLSHIVADLLGNIPIIPGIIQSLPGLYNIVTGFASTIPAYRLHFLPEPSFWWIITHRRDQVKDIGVIH